MSLISKFRRTFAIAALLILVTLSSLPRWNTPAVNLATSSTSTISRTDPAVPSDWTFRAGRDRNNHSLTIEQCQAAFPDLYREIDRSRTYWKARQGDRFLTEEQWNLEWSADGGMRLMIWEGQLYIIESRGLNHFRHWKERSHATLHNLQRAIVGARQPVPNIEFSIKINDDISLTEDHANTTVWSFSRDVTNKVMEQVWLIPDFNFWAYPRVASAYGDFQRQAIETGSNYDSKIPKLIWRGTTDFNPDIRLPLLAQSEGKSWSDVHKVVEDASDEEASRYRIAMSDHCNYKFAVHTEGTTWSGRLKYLLSCHSTVLIHPLTYTTHLYHLLEPDGPNQNFVLVDKKWEALPATMNSLLQDNAKAKKIADNAAAKFRDRYLTPAAQTCYFRQLFHIWSEMTPVPDPYQYIMHRDGRQSKKWRGMTYEEYVFLETGYNDA